MRCPRCGTESLPNDKFCKSCGSPLINAESAQSPAAAVAATSPPQAVPPPAPLHPIPPGGLMIGDVVTWLQSAGYLAKVVTGSSGNPHIESAAQGTEINIFMDDRRDDRCASIRFAAGFSTNGKFDISQMNEWNKAARWVRGYYDSVNDPWIEMDIDLYPGGTYESLNDQFVTWNNMLGKFIRKYSLL
jgi:hypothetical protein